MPTETLTGGNKGKGLLWSPLSRPRLPLHLLWRLLNLMRRLSNLLRPPWNLMRLPLLSLCQLQ
jgi:hypothetical protein